jgi:putative ABC transport system substrate-binding protein
MERLFKWASESRLYRRANVMIEPRWAEGKPDRLPDLATELVSRKVDVIVSTGGTVTAFAAKNATSSIPIVFTVGGDLVKLGLIGSLARPGGNLTGLSLLTTELNVKHLELLQETLPTTRTIGIMETRAIQTTSFRLKRR